MNRPFSLFLGLRYLKPKRTFVSVITLISILGVTLGIAVPIIVISVMTGFDHELQRKVLGFEPEVDIRSDGTIGDWRGLLKKLHDTPSVAAAAPFVQGPVIVEHGDLVSTPLLQAIDPEAEQKVVDLRRIIVDGTFELTGESVILGRILADSLNARVGDKITITGPGNIRAIINEIHKEGDDPKSSKKLSDLKDEIAMPADLKVTGIFESGRYDYDANVLFVPLEIGQELYDMEDTVHGIAIKTANQSEDPNRAANDTKAALNKILLPPAFAQTWMDRNRDRFDAIRLERSVMFFILMFIVIVAAFGIMNTLITVTVQKTRDIGIMKALGATTAQIVWVFLGQGLVVGLFGNAAGLALGIGLVRYRNEFRDWLSGVLHIQIFPADIYEFSSIPAEIVPRDVAVICISAFFICGLAALIPAYFAARLDPVKALRYE